jgi:cytochrome c oxidase assembly protein subunit 15
MWLQLALKAVLIALIPLALVWVSNDKNKYRKLTWVTLFLTFDLIMFGAFTRLTDSGLGCPDWPGCYGQSNPFLAHAEISAAQQAMPTGPVTVAKAWIEMIHRYLAMTVGVLIICLVVAAWRGWIKSARRDTKFAPWTPMLLLVLVCVQGAFGAWTVTMKLQPIIVTIHLLLALVLLSMLVWLGARQTDHLAIYASSRRLAWPATIAVTLLAIQIALGGWVSTNYAALACSDFPLCHGELVPEMDFSNGFELWRHLGRTASGDFLPFPALTAIHWTHRMFAIVVITAIVWLGLRAYKDPGLRKLARALLGVIGLQFLSGVATVYFNWPLAIAVIHNGGAALLILLLIMLNYKARHAPTTPDVV